MKTVTLGTGLAFWGDALRPAKEMVERADIIDLPKIGQRITSVLMRLGTSPTGMMARTFMA